jgi:hypothetical protein
VKKQRGDKNTKEPLEEGEGVGEEEEEEEGGGGGGQMLEGEKLGETLDLFFVWRRRLRVYGAWRACLTPSASRRSSRMPCTSL